MTRDQLLDHLTATRERHARTLGLMADVHAAWCEAEDIVAALDLPDGSLVIDDVFAAADDATDRERLRHLFTVRMYALDPPTDLPEGDDPS